MARMHVWVWGGIGIGMSFSGSKAPREEEEGKFGEGKEEELTPNMAIQLSYGPIGEYLE